MALTPTTASTSVTLHADHREHDVNHVTIAGNIIPQVTVTQVTYLILCDNVFDMWIRIQLYTIC